MLSLELSSTSINLLTVDCMTTPSCLFEYSSQITSLELGSFIRQQLINVFSLKKVLTEFSLARLVWYILFNLISLMLLIFFEAEFGRMPSFGSSKCLHGARK